MCAPHGSCRFDLTVTPPTSQVVLGVPGTAGNGGPLQCQTVPGTLNSPRYMAFNTDGTVIYVSEVRCMEHTLLSKLELEQCGGQQP